MFWMREVAGWLLVALGLAAFGVAYFDWIRIGRIFPAGPIVLMGIFMFRGGIHLLKVAVAARVCQRPEPNPPRAQGLSRLR